MTDKDELIEHYHRVLINIYKEKNLKCLRGIRNEYEINGRNILIWRANATKPFLANEEFNFTENESDTYFISDELWHFTASAYLYLPYINNPLKDKFTTAEGVTIFPNIQNVYSLKYDIYTSTAFEKIYNFWDRIGDLIAACIDTGLQKRQIYFPKVIENIPGEFRTGENFEWLSNFCSTDYKEMNKKRRNIVHYNTTGTEFKMNHLNSASNEQKMTDLFEERCNIPNYLRGAISNTITGYSRVLDYLIEIAEDV